jgi:hypothetical protein
MFLYENEDENHELDTGDFVHKGIILEAERVQFVSDRMSYVTLRGRWCDTIFLHVHAPVEDMTENTRWFKYDRD